MKILKHNLFNRLFRNEALGEQKEEYIIAKRRIERADEYIKTLNVCGNLSKMVDIHKEIWDNGFQHENIGPGPYFKVKSISELKPKDVYLGNIYGLFTHPIPFWEKQKKEQFGENEFGIKPETKIHKLILRQYRKILISNLTIIVQADRDYVEEYNKVNKITT